MQPEISVSCSGLVRSATPMSLASWQRQVASVRKTCEDSLSTKLPEDMYTAERRNRRPEEAKKRRLMNDNSFLSCIKMMSNFRARWNSSCVRGLPARTNQPRKLKSLALGRAFFPCLKHPTLIPPEKHSSDTVQVHYQRKPYQSAHSRLGLRQYELMFKY